jgi:hypothetical protein
MNHAKGVHGVDRSVADSGLRMFAREFEGK